MKKTAKVPQGIHLKKSSKGFSIHIHADNGNKLAVLTGYDQRASALKAVMALDDILVMARTGGIKPIDAYTFTDHTKAPKKRTTKK